MAGLAERWLVPAPGQIWDCSACGLRRVWPQPFFDENRERFENEAYYIKTVGVKREHFSSRVAFIRSLLSTSQNRLLDVGCGRGEMLLEARAAGFEVTGIELSKYAAVYGREKYGLNISNTPIEELPRSAFDVIHSSHVMEHVLNPLEFAAHLKRALTPNGICVLEVPNEFMNVMARLNDLIGRPRRRQLPSIHLFFFDPSTLRRVMETAGFETIQISTYSGRFASNSSSFLRKADSILRNIIRSVADGVQKGENIIYVGR